MVENFTADEVNELAEVFHSMAAAGQLLAAAGLPYSGHPTWLAESSLQWWHEIDVMMANGRLVDGRRRILAEALRRYPGNAVFAAGVGAWPETANAALRPETSSRLPAELISLLRMMRQMRDTLPKAFRSAHRTSLSGIYVRQSVAVPAELRRPRERVPEELLGREPGWVEEARRTSALAQPFDDVLEQHDHLVVEGAAGLGKTTLGYQLAGRLAGTLLDGHPDAKPAWIPLVVPARVLAESLTRGWGEALRDALVMEYGAVLDGAVTLAMLANTAHGVPWFIVVDALDEIPDEASRQRLLTALAMRMSTLDATARFLVTTRPLPPGETALLTGPRVGFYELQPFDAKALDRFASRWFDPDETPEGAVAAREFLDQVATAGLGDILAVPLLAALAAQVHESQMDRPLPGSRYELYERYIDHLAAARGGTTPAPVGRPAEAGDYLRWLDRHRIELLEALATGYTTSERPLLDTARDFERNHPTPPESIPADRGELLGSWLSDTGLVSRRGRRLGFLHQTFAEHLAARSRARDLPATFVADEPVWDELLRGLLLDDEASQRVFLHYLHRQGAGADALTWLLRGSLRERDEAATLVTDGAPCDFAQLEAFLAHVEERVAVGSWDENRIRTLVAPARRAEVRSRLRALLSRANITPIVKIAVVDVVRARSTRGTDRDLVSLLMGWTQASQPADVRRAAAMVLASVGESDHAYAIGVLRTMALDGDERDEDRMDAAVALAAFGAGHRDEAAAMLQSLAIEAISSVRRRSAAEELSKLGDAHRHTAAQALKMLAKEPGKYPWERVDAAKALGDLGGEHRTDAARLLIHMASSANVIQEKTSAIAAAAAIDPAQREATLMVLNEIATSLTNDGYSRRAAAAELAAFGSEARRQAAEALRIIATDVDESADLRVETVRELADLGPLFLPEAVCILLDLIDDPTIDADQRVRAVETLAGCGQEHLATAVRALWRIFADRTVPLPIRSSAAVTMASLGVPHRRQVLAELERRGEDLALPPDEQLLGAAVRAAIEPDERAAIAASVAEATANPRIGVQARLLTAATLRDLGERHIPGAAEQLRAVLAEGAALEAETRREAAEKLGELGTLWQEEARAAFFTTSDGPDAKVRWSHSMIRFRRRAGSGVGVARMLAELGSDLTDHYLAVNALAELGEFRGRSQVLAIMMLRKAAGGPLRASTWLDNAIDGLRQLGKNGRDAAQQLLREAATDPTLPAWIRGRCSLEVVEVDRDSRSEVAENLLSAAGDPTVKPREQIGAAVTAAFSLDHRTRAVETVRAALCNPFYRGFTPFTWDYSRPEAARQLWAQMGDAAGFQIGLDRAMADPTESGSVRGQAAWEAAARGGAHRPDAVVMLLRLANDPAAESGDRSKSAWQLARLGGEYRSDAAAALGRIANDPLTVAAHRRRAAWRWASLGAAHRPSAAAALMSVVTDTAADADERREAAAAVARLGGPAARTLVAYARERAGDVAAGAADRITAAWILACLDPGAAPLTAGIVEAVASGGGADASDRLQAAECLRELGPAYVARCVVVLGSLLDDPFEGPSMMREAAWRLIKFGTDQRDRAGDALLSLSCDPAVPAGVRREAAWQLVAMRPALRDQATGALLAISADPLVAGDERGEASWSLASLGGEYHEQGLGALAAVAGDPIVDAAPRLETIWRLARFPARRAEALDLLIALAEEPGVDDDTRVEAATRLRRFDGEQRERAYALLRSWADSPTIGPATRAAAAIAATASADEAIPILGRAVADAAIPPAERREGARRLGKLGVAGHATALATLSGLAADPGVDADIRLDATWDLIGVDLGHRASAIRLLAAFAADETIGPAARTTAAWRLARLGPPHHPAAAAALGEIAVDPTTSGNKRRDAARRWARLGAEYRPSAAATLITIVTDGVSDPDTRAAAARIVSALGGEHADGLSAYALRTASDPVAPADDRLFAAELVVLLEPARAAFAAGLVAQIAAEPATGGRTRLRAAEILDGLGTAQTPHALGLRRDLLDDEPADPELVRAAAKHLAQIGGADRVRAEQALARLTGDPTVAPGQRRQAAWQLAKTSPSGRGRAAAALLDLATDPLVDGRNRGEAAWSLARLGGEHRSRALDAFAALAVDPAVEADTRLEASRRLARFGTPPRTEAIRALTQLAGDPSAPGTTRVEAAAFILACGDGHRACGRDLLTALASDPTLEPHHQVFADVAAAGTVKAAATILECAVADPALRPDQLLEVVRRFGLLGSFPRSLASEVLLRVVSDPRVPGTDRCAAAQELIRYDSTAGAAALATLTEDGTIHPADRRAAASRLVAFNEHRAQAIATLISLASEMTLPPHERRQAALALASRGPTARAEARKLLLALTAQPSIDAQVRRLAGQDLASVQVDGADETIRTLVAIGDDERGAEPHDQIDALRALLDLGTAARRAAAELARRVIARSAGSPLLLAQATAALGLLDAGERARAEDLLVQVASDPTVDATGRRDSAMMIGPVDRRYAELGADLLFDIAKDPALRAWDRRRTADMLAALGPRLRRRAVEIMLAVAVDASADPWERTEAAVAVAELDRDRRPQMTEMLHHRAGDSTVTIDQRIHAAKALLRAGPEPRRRAGELLRALAGLDAATPAERRCAAALLCTVAGEPFATGQNVLRSLADDPSAAPVDRALALHLLAQWDHRLWPSAAIAFRQVAADPDGDPTGRRIAATQLAVYGGDDRLAAAAVLRGLAGPLPDRPGGPPRSADIGESTASFERLMAHGALTAFEPVRLLAAAQELRAAVIGTTLTLDERRQVACVLAATGPDNRARALRVLAGIVVDTGGTPSHRLAAATGLAEATGTDRRIIALGLQA